jgi:Rrf2 family transcriptional regulator, cysteine metabolism repressor
MALQLSTRSRYGVRLMTVLALGWGGGPSLLRDVSNREGISEKYLGQIVIPLKAAGLVVAQRGSHGGYSLGRAPEGITVKDVVEAIDGAVAPATCVEASDGECVEAGCERASDCAATQVWHRLRDDIERSLSSFTLADLARSTRQMSEKAADYTI